MVNEGIKTVHKGSRPGTLIVGAIALALGMMSGLASAEEVYHFTNGITATIYSPVEISDLWTTQGKNGTYLTHPASGSIELNDPTGTMHPFAKEGVVAALGAMNGFVTDVDVDVFILPAIPTRERGSFARRNTIYLAPGIGPVDPSTLAYITVHEMGHVLTWVFVDPHPDRWKVYLDIRGLKEMALSSDLRHADRAREILAEDIRALFGGPLATVSGSIENHDLIHPQWVPGLQEMLAGFFVGQNVGPLVISSSAFPNPFNPRTTIEMALPVGRALGGGSASLRIFDIRGAAVKTLSGGFIANNRLTIQWDGTNQSGEGMPSGRYLYVIGIGHLVSKGAVTLLR